MYLEGQIWINREIRIAGKPACGAGTAGLVSRGHRGIPSCGLLLLPRRGLNGLHWQFKEAGTPNVLGSKMIRKKF
jgi:hypothetical protein